LRKMRSRFFPRSSQRVDRKNLKLKIKMKNRRFLYSKHVIHQTPRKLFLTHTERKNAVKLIAENPLHWKPKILAEKFSVDKEVILTEVPLPTRKQISNYRYEHGLLKPLRDPVKELKIRDWEQNQINNILSNKLRKKKWIKAAKKELNNIDFPWFYGIEERTTMSHNKGLLRMEALKLRKKDDE